MRLRLILIIITAFAMGGVAAFGLLMFMQPPSPAKVVASAGKPLVGGPFTLTDHTGKTVSEKDFLGRHMLVYFGFTNCPDVCPTELQVITTALETLGDKAKEITPVLISVDPERDTVEKMAAYVDHFHDRLVGLTGTPEQIKAAAKAFRVYYKKVDDQSSSAGYTIDHSSIVYLMDDKGAYAAHFAYGTDPAKMAAKIAEKL